MFWVLIFHSFQKLKLTLNFKMKTNQRPFWFFLFCLVCAVFQGRRPSSLLRSNWQVKKSMRCFPPPPPILNLSLICRTGTLSFSVSYVFALILFSSSDQILTAQIFAAAPYTGVYVLERHHLYKFVCAETPHVGFRASLLPFQGRWDR